MQEDVLHFATSEACKEVCGSAGLQLISFPQVLAQHNYAIITWPNLLSTRLAASGGVKGCEKQLHIHACMTHMTLQTDACRLLNICYTARYPVDRWSRYLQSCGGSDRRYIDAVKSGKRAPSGAYRYEAYCGFELQLQSAAG